MKRAACCLLVDCAGVCVRACVVVDAVRLSWHLAMAVKGAALKSGIGRQIENKSTGPSPHFQPFSCRAWECAASFGLRSLSSICCPCSAHALPMHALPAPV